MFFLSYGKVYSFPRFTVFNLFICLRAFLSILTTLYCCHKCKEQHKKCVHAAINSLIPESDQHLISPFKIILNQTLSYENKRNDKQQKNLLIVKQILLACTLGIV